MNVCWVCKIALFCMCSICIHSQKRTKFVLFTVSDLVTKNPWALRIQRHLTRAKTSSTHEHTHTHIEMGVCRESSVWIRAPIRGPRECGIYSIPLSFIRIYPKKVAKSSRKRWNERDAGSLSETCIFMFELPVSRFGVVIQFKSPSFISVYYFNI